VPDQIGTSLSLETVYVIEVLSPENTSGCGTMLTTLRSGTRSTTLVAANARLLPASMSTSVDSTMTY
jgi:hypothetical protein